MWPKSKAIVIMTFTPPKGLDATRIPVFSGYVAINGSSGDSLSLPYAGVAAKLKDVKLMDTPDGFPYVASSADTNSPIGNSSVFTFSSGTSSNTSVVPVVVYALAMGSRIIKIEVVYEPARGQDRVLGSIPGYPFENCPRNVLETASWDGTLSSGKKVPEGSYHFLISALKIFGNTWDEKDWERYETISFEVKFSK